MRGFGYIEIIIVCAVVSFAGAAVLTYNSAIKGRAEAERQRDEALVGKAEAESQIIVEKANSDARRIVALAERDRMVAAHARTVENVQRSERAAAKASEARIRATAERAPEKYTAFVRKALPRNLEAIRCRSDLSTVGDPRACPLTVR